MAWCATQSNGNRGASTLSECETLSTPYGISVRRKPLTMARGGGTVLASTSILRCSQERHDEWHYFASGLPTQNALVGSFNERRRPIMGARH